MRRREFITLLGGAAAAWPLAARAQKPVRRIGFLMPYAAGEPVGQARLAAFLQALQQLGWAEGRNVHVDTRWAGGNEDDVRRQAAELAASTPEVILANGSAAAGPLLQATRTIPVVFVIVPDPVGAGYVESLARPGENATGFSMFEYGIAGKWLELLKQIAPIVTRVLHVIRLLLTGSPPRLATFMPTGLPVAPRGKDCDSSTKRLPLAATIHARAAPAKNSNAATERRTSRCIRPPKSALLPAVPAQALRPSFFRLFQFFDQTG